MTGGHEVEDDRQYESWAARDRLSAVEARNRTATVKSEQTRKALLKLAVEYDERAADFEQRLALEIPK
jgi:hypothetical protein